MNFDETTIQPSNCDLDKTFDPLPPRYKDSQYYRNVHVSCGTHTQGNINS